MTDNTAPDLRRTPLTGVHERLGATLTGFAGWLMPLRYGSESAEHAAVRTAAGLFDLSHMGEISVTGQGAAAALDYALVGQPSAQAPGRARYSMICSADGGIIDDLIVYRLAEAEFLIVANAANTDAVCRALAERAGASGEAGALAGSRAGGRDVTVTDKTADYALVAVQGPAAAAILGPLTDADLAGVRYYASYPAALAGAKVLLARTGYTGEDGFEVFAAPADAERIWDALASAGERHGLVPAGLAARDTLRLEAGMPLYGNELSADVTPFDAGLGRVVKLDKPGDFVGRQALAARAAAAPERVLIGLASRSRRVPRHGYPVLWDGAPCGTVTSGAPSPTLGVPIAMAYVSPEVARMAGAGGGAGQGKPPAQGSPLRRDSPPGTGAGSTRLAIDVRGRSEPADPVLLPFYRRSA